MKGSKLGRLSPSGPWLLTPHLAFLVMGDVREYHPEFGSPHQPLISLYHLPTRGTLRENRGHFKELLCKGHCFFMGLQGERV